MKIVSTSILLLLLAGCTAVRQEPVQTQQQIAGLESLIAFKTFRATNIRAGCPPEGNAKADVVKTLNVLKNRADEPKPSDTDVSVTLEQLLAPGDDEERWDESRAADIVGFVHEVKPGGLETTNCKAPDQLDRDTHIELVLAVDDNGPTRRVVVEVTPRWRDTMRSRGVDWSTASLRASIKNKWIRVKGWLFLDFEHINQSENTKPGNQSNWRGTAWEIHPITSLEILPGKP
ncbi:MAG: hypothetical protein IPP88_13390 [Betaproteobacteria bacterium]|nr:hypothetical protein [Betaproteobacteria bacterium]